MLVRPFALVAVVVAVSGALLGCGTSGDSTFDGGSGEGDGGIDESGNTMFTDAGAGDGSASDVATGMLTITIRDFRLFSAADDAGTVPDFENYPHINPGTGLFDPSYEGNEDDHDIVTDTLGVDGKPVYKGGDGGVTITTHGKATFDLWYRDTPGKNLNVQYPLVLSAADAGVSEYDSEKSGVPLSAGDPTKMFFPIDDGTPLATAFGNQGDPHNYSFTVELHTLFTYHGGEFFNFRGDDDVFVYINNKLVINLGGIHGAEPASVNVDSLGLTVGQEYPLDFFSAERHRTGSNILVTTTLGLRPAPPR